ncbi:GNAT family N-acetyltransferase [Carboxylicivirga marina]|uniref:GNAT family N-acetyltransferase n=1 Tax=Carboxylicivirga marina TaxID=2800988 RepID=A0ABS1HF77_9BACT|nr:GNAT family N-acetyltransferase [Carboxylicivirga marina]MBK3516323.1 GNAT family N-acetyltransferase [Carboxylicivirga marina]
MDNYIFTKANNKEELSQLVKLYNTVFAPEEVGKLADTLTHHFPNMGFNNWYIAKDKNTDEVVSGFAFIPWQWQFNGLKLKVAELGILGTYELHRGKGLFKQCNALFENDLKENDFDLAVIQGIPGIYHRLGYHYAIPMENHTELPLQGLTIDDSIEFRKINKDNYALLNDEEDLFNERYHIGVNRTCDHWDYIQTKGLKTEYASELYIFDYKEKSYYLRLLKQGFGQGLILSEISFKMPADAHQKVFSFLKKRATILNKPYIRLNLPDSHPLIKSALACGATIRPSYAWQVKIVDKVKFLNKIKPILEQRIADSQYNGLSSTISINMYNYQIILKWTNGQLVDITNEGDVQADFTLSIREELLTQLLLGYRTWQELQYIHHDVFPADQYLRMDVNHPSEMVGLLFDVLFPKLNNWINGQY